ncbi:MAG: hypothetical protein WA239_14660 [Candidatus Sulfotelmatobacter sp.]
MMVQSSLLETVHSPEFLQKIQRSLGSSTIALFVLLDDHGNERLEPAGTGTLVVIANRYYILTAAHVWERLESALRFGISLIENRDHKMWIDPKTIAPTLVKPPDSRWNEWGPDVALLNIPEVIVGGIKAHRVFEDLTTPGKMLNAPTVEFWAVMGTPKELGTFTPHHAEVQIAAFFGNPKYQRRGEHDYYDLEVNTTSPGMPKSFQGVSGGGLWRILAYISEETKKVDWVPRLKGVAFFELAAVGDNVTIRCHGPKSLTAVTHERVELDVNTLADTYIRYAMVHSSEDAWAEREAATFVRENEIRGLALVRLMLSLAESDPILDAVAVGPLKQFIRAHGKESLCRTERVAQGDSRLQRALKRLE